MNEKPDKTGNGGSNFQQEKNEPVDQHHKFNDEPGDMPGFQNGNYVCHRSAKGQEIQTGNTGKGSENELDPVINPFPASAYVPGSHRKGKCIKGNRRDIYNNGRCADEQKGAWDLHQFPIAAGRNTAFFYGKTG